MTSLLLTPLLNFYCDTGSLTHPNHHHQVHAPSTRYVFNRVNRLTNLLATSWMLGTLKMPSFWHAPSSSDTEPWMLRRHTVNLKQKSNMP